MKYLYKEKIFDTMDDVMIAIRINTTAEDVVKKLYDMANNICNFIKSTSVDKVFEMMEDKNKNEIINIIHSEVYNKEVKVIYDEEIKCKLN